MQLPPRLASQNGTTGFRALSRAWGHRSPLHNHPPRAAWAVRVDTFGKREPGPVRADTFGKRGMGPVRADTFGSGGFGRNVRQERDGPRPGGHVRVGRVWPERSAREGRAPSGRTRLARAVWAGTSGNNSGHVRQERRGQLGRSGRTRWQRARLGWPNRRRWASSAWRTLAEAGWSASPRSTAQPLSGTNSVARQPARHKTHGRHKLCGPAGRTAQDVWPGTNSVARQAFRHKRRAKQLGRVGRVARHAARHGSCGSYVARHES